MNDNYKLTENDIANLIKASKELKFGEMITGELEKRVINGSSGTPKVVGKFIPDKTDEEKFLGITENKVISFPFNITREDKIVATGSITPTTSKLAKNGFKMVRGFVERTKNAIKELSTPEQNLNYYVDEKGRPYELIDETTRAYQDDRGFEYYLKWDMEGNEIAWLQLEDGSIADFLDPERNIILVNGHAYMMGDDGLINYENEVSYIGPHR